MAGPSAVWVDGPPVEPRPFGLFTAAQVVDDADPRWLMGGARHEVDYCGQAYDSAGVCFDFGTLSVEVSDASAATITATGVPDGEYQVLWGDEEEGDGPETFPVITGASHTYEADDDYTITVTGPQSYLATVTITVVDGEEAEPVVAEVGIGKTASEGIETVEGDPFAVLYLFACNPVGKPLSDMQERARKALQMGEQRTVERVVARALARDEDAVYLQSATTFTAVDGLAALERYAGQNYPGRATIHATPDLVTILDAKGALRRESSGGVEHIETVQGTRVVSGGGYAIMGLRGPEADLDEELEPNSAGTEHMYVTGAVQIRRSGVIEANAIDTTRNRMQVLAERPYVVTWDCINAAVKVSTAEDGT